MLFGIVPTLIPLAGFAFGCVTPPTVTLPATNVVPFGILSRNTTFSALPVPVFGTVIV